MSQYDSIKEYIRHYQERYGDKAENKDLLKPIFELVVFEKPNAETIYHTENGDIASGYPDTGGENNVGFYYDLDDAIQAMNENSLDIQEHCFHAGFVLCRFPGLYNAVIKDARMYFLWDPERGGFFEAPEPEIFKHIAY